jgi:polyisoprenoid-binding protein YceI
MTTSTSTTLPLVPGQWTLDPNHSSVGFTIRHLGVSKVRGRFDRFDAQVVIGEDLASTSVSATIDLASIDTGQPDRDAHARAADMLDVERRPTMAFRSTRITSLGESYVLEGDLTIGDVTRPIELDLEFGGLQEFPGGPRHAGFEATGELRRKDFGLDLSLPPGLGSALLSDVVKLELDIQLLEPTE